MLSFIVNKCSRGGKGALVWDEIEEYLKKRDIEYAAKMTEYAGHATKLAEEMTACVLEKNNEVTLIAVGGDGTIGEVINGISDFSKVRFGVVPVGSGNDFARGLKLSKEPIENLESIINCLEEDVIDIGSVVWDDGSKQRYFAVSSGIGIDAEVCKRILASRLKGVLNKIRLGKLTYLIVTVQSLFSMDTSDVSIRFDGNEVKKIRKLIFNAVMNFRTEGGGVPMAPKADARDGLLSICCIHTIPKLATFFFLPFLVIGKHHFINGIDIENHKTCDIILKKPMPLHADGEYLGETDRVSFKCRTKRLRMLNCIRK